MSAASPSTLPLGLCSSTDAGADLGQAIRHVSADPCGAVLEFDAVETLPASAVCFDSLAAGPLLLPPEPDLLSAPGNMKSFLNASSTKAITIKSNTVKSKALK